MRRALFLTRWGRAASEPWCSPWGSNQLFGEDLRVAAAELLGENLLVAAIGLTAATSTVAS